MIQIFTVKLYSTEKIELKLLQHDLTEKKNLQQASVLVIDKTNPKLQKKKVQIL